MASQTTTAAFQRGGIVGRAATWAGSTGGGVELATTKPIVASSPLARKSACLSVLLFVARWLNPLPVRRRQALHPSYPDLAVLVQRNEPRSASSAAPDGGNLDDLRFLSRHPSPPFTIPRVFLVPA